MAKSKKKYRNKDKSKDKTKKSKNGKSKDKTKKSKSGGTQKSTQKNITKSFKYLTCSPKANLEKAIVHDNQMGNDNETDLNSKFTDSATCLTEQEILNNRDLWNDKFPDDLIVSDNLSEIWNALKVKMKDTCDTEFCWVKELSKTKSKSSKHKDIGGVDSYAPTAPEEWVKNPKEWLSNFDIEKVINQYKKAYKCFEFFGPTPIDYDASDEDNGGKCVWEDLCHFDLKKWIDKGKFKLGIIFNTDTHEKGGSHWVSMFINVKTETIYYFNSTGEKCPDRIMKLVDEIVRQGAEMNPPINFKFDSNYPTEHQMNTYSCGMYSLFFIIHMLEDKITGEYLKTHKLKDSYIETFRTKYFNSPDMM